MAGLAAAAIGAGGSILGGALGGKKAEAPSPWEQSSAQIQANNPSRSGYWGSTDTILDKGEKIKGRQARADDTYTVQSNMSPELQALSEMLAQRAGASRGTYSSGGMPEHLQQRYSQVGYDQSMAPGERRDRMQALREGGSNYYPEDLSPYRATMGTFDRPEFGFGGGDGAAQVATQAPAEVTTQPFGTTVSWEANREPDTSKYDVEALQNLIASLGGLGVAGGGLSGL